MGWKELLGHSRTWAVVIAVVFQALVAGGVLALGEANVEYIQAHAPIILGALWSALVLGKSYEDRVNKGTTSALAVWRGQGKEGGWVYALKRLLADEGFVSTFFGTVIAVVTLAAPLWLGLPQLEGLFTSLAYAVTTIFSILTGALKYSAAHSEGTLTSPPEPPTPSG